MTFYWWSHWFWITLLSVSLTPISIVHTYPSSDIAVEYNPKNATATSMKPITKLFKAGTTVAWATPPPSNSSNTATIAMTRTVLRNVPIDKLIESLEETVIEQEEFIESSTDSEEKPNELEFKRSVENYIKNVTTKQVDSTAAEDATQMLSDAPAPDNASKAVKLKRGPTEINNYTNFTSASSDNFNHTQTSSDHLDRTPYQNSSSVSSIEANSPPVADTIPAPIHTDADYLDDDVTTVTAADAQIVPFTLENANREDELRRAENEHRSRKSKVLSAEYKHINRFINLSSDTKNLLTRSASTAPNDYDGLDEGNISSEALSVQRTYFLDAGAISAICFTVFGICCTVGTLGIVLYRRRYLNKPQALSEPDSSVYIDDSTMRDNSDEMYSLDNDSFLNSLEAMTIQNYWTDTVKHTKL